MIVKKKMPLTENVFTVSMATNLSLVINKSRYRNMLIFMPATWTTADITFAVSSTKTGTFSKLVVAETDVTPKEIRIKDPVASTIISLTGKVKDALEACSFIKLRSGTALTPINQDSSRTFTIILMG